MVRQIIWISEKGLTVTDGTLKCDIKFRKQYHYVYLFCSQSLTENLSNVDIVLTCNYLEIHVPEHVDIGI